MTHRRQDWRKILEKGFVLPKIDRSTSLPDAISAVTEAVQDHLSESKSVRSYLACLPKGAGTYCPNSKVGVIQDYVSFQGGNIDKSNPEVLVAFIRKIIMPMFDFERRQILKAARMIDGINSSEKFLLRAGAIIARATDHIWVKWFERMVSPYQKMTLEERRHFESRISESLRSPGYTVFDFDPATGFSGQQTWAEAFPREIRIICRILKLFTRKKLKLSRRSVLPAYFKALRLAYECQEIDQLKKRWSAVNRLWVQIHDETRILPMHSLGIGYEHPCCISPEFRLEVRIINSNQAEFNNIRLGVELCVDALVGMEDAKISSSIQELKRTEINFFECAIRSGASMNFLLGGEMVPNFEDVPQEGGKILLARSAISSTAACLRHDIRRHCTSSTRGFLRRLPNYNTILQHFIGHEFSHIISSQENLLEEAKATVLGILANEYLESTPEKHLELVALAVGSILDSLHYSEINDQTMVDYTREHLLLANTLFRSGVIKMTKSGLRVNVEQARSRAWFEELEEFICELLWTHHRQDESNLERLVKRYCKRTGPVAELIAWINRD